MFESVNMRHTFSLESIDVEICMLSSEEVNAEACVSLLERANTEVHILLIESTNVKNEHSYLEVLT
jgi:hypothetical protein